MRFLYIKVLQILNQMVDLMLIIVGHAPRDRYLHSTWGGGAMQLMSPQRKLWWTWYLRPWFRDVGLCKDQVSTPSWL